MFIVITALSYTKLVPRHPLELRETNISNKNSTVTNFNWRMYTSKIIYMLNRGVDLGSTVFWKLNNDVKLPIANFGYFVKHKPTWLIFRIFLCS